MNNLPGCPNRWITRADKMARLLDDGFLIPGTTWRIGLDPLMGLIPGWGDLLSAIASLYIPYCGIRMRCPRSLVLRMLLNIGLDALVSVIPVLGDLFDFAFKANRRNSNILADWWEQRSKEVI